VPAVVVNERELPMKLKIGIGVAIASVAVFGLSACSSDAKSNEAAPAVTASAMATAPGDADPTPDSGDAPAALGTADTALGTIVVDGKGMAVYEFDTDTQGGDSSTCTGACATNWPAVPGGASAPTLDGVTGTAGTITGADGQPQLTLNGWPLYYFAGDAAVGDINGQGVGGVWWVLTPAGDPITN